MTAAVSHKLSSIKWSSIFSIFAPIQLHQHCFYICRCSTNNKVWAHEIHCIEDKDSLIKTACIIRTSSQCWNIMVFYQKEHPGTFTDSKHSFVCKTFFDQSVSSSFTKSRIVEIPQLFHMREDTWTFIDSKHSFVCRIFFNLSVFH